MFRIDTPLEIIEVEEEEKGPRLAIVNMPVIHSAFAFNIDNARSILKYLEKLGVKTVILPPFMPFGVNNSQSLDELENIAINRRNPYVRILKNIALTTRLHILSPYVYEKTPRGYYVSNLFIDGELGFVRFFSRKICLLSNTEKSILKRGNRLETIEDQYVNFTVLLDDDALIPEFARYYTLIGVHFIVTVFKDLAVDKVKLVLEALRLFTGVSVIHVGYSIVHGDDYLAKAPTILLLSNGENYVFDNNPAVVTLPLRLVRREITKRPSSDDAKYILRVLFHHLKSIYRIKEHIQVLGEELDRGESNTAQNSYV